MDQMFSDDADHPVDVEASADAVELQVEHDGQHDGEHEAHGDEHEPAAEVHDEHGARDDEHGAHDDEHGAHDEPVAEPAHEDLIPMHHPDGGECDAYPHDKAGNILVPARHAAAMFAHGFQVGEG